MVFNFQVGMGMIALLQCIIPPYKVSITLHEQVQWRFQETESVSVPKVQQPFFLMMKKW